MRIIDCNCKAFLKHSFIVWEVTVVKTFLVLFRERTSGIPGAMDKRESRKDGIGMNVIGLGQRKGNLSAILQFPIV